MPTPKQLVERGTQLALTWDALTARSFARALLNELRHRDHGHAADMRTKYENVIEQWGHKTDPYSIAVFIDTAIDELVTLCRARGNHEDMDTFAMLQGNMFADAWVLG